MLWIQKHTDLSKQTKTVTYDKAVTRNLLGGVLPSCSPSLSPHFEVAAPEIQLKDLGERC